MPKGKTLTPTCKKSTTGWIQTECSQWSWTLTADMTQATRLSREVCGFFETEIGEGWGTRWRWRAVSKQLVKLSEFPDRYFLSTQFLHTKSSSRSRQDSQAHRIDNMRIMQDRNDSCLKKHELSRSFASRYVEVSAFDTSSSPHYQQRATIPKIH